MVKRSRLSGKVTATDRGSLSGYFRRTQRSLLDLPWEILQVILISTLFLVCFYYRQCFNKRYRSIENWLIWTSEDTLEKKKKKN